MDSIPLLPKAISKTLASYKMGFFLIALNDKKDIPKKKYTETFCHEYIHLMQNLSSPFYLKFHEYSLKLLASTINDLQTTAKNTGMVQIPIKKITSDDLLLYNIWCYIWSGSSNNRMGICHVVELRPCPLGYNQQTIVCLKCSDDTQAFDYFLGATAVAESMASIAEKILFPNIQENNNLPYSAVQLLAGNICPKLLEHPDILLASCDIALMSNNPGLALYRIFEMLSKNMVNSYHDLYQLMECWKLNDETNQGWKNLQEYYRDCMKEAVSSISGSLGGYLAECAKRSISFLNKSHSMREKCPSYLVDSITQGLTNFSHLVCEIGIPIIVVKDAIYTSETTDDIIGLAELWAVYNSITTGQGCCLLPYCTNSPEDKKNISTKCGVTPWEKYGQKELCPYSAIWGQWFGKASVKIC